LTFLKPARTAASHAISDRLPDYRRNDESGDKIHVDGDVIREYPTVEDDLLELLGLLKTKILLELLVGSSERLGHIAN